MEIFVSAATEGSHIRRGVRGPPRAPKALGYFVAVYAFSCFSEHHLIHFKTHIFLRFEIYKIKFI